MPSSTSPRLHASRVSLRHLSGAPCRAAWRIVVIGAVLGVSGCATYVALPLDAGHGAYSVQQLSASTAHMGAVDLGSHRLDVSDGLDVTEVAMLAVANSPALKVRRDERGIAQAQAFAAGLLPDPQLSVGEDFPRHPGTGLTSAFNLGLSADISALLMRSSRAAVARRQADQVNLDLLWAEWQTVTQARLLFDQITTWHLQHARLEAEQAALAPVERYIEMALGAGNLTYDSASAGLNAGADVNKRLADADIAGHQADTDLHVLLGLSHDAPLHLVGAPDRVLPAPAQLRQALADLPARRPDLLALQAGYQSQEAKLRGAVLAQFPALTLGFNTARDTSAIYTNGFTVGITLPLFDRNRGAIAIETATRQQLKDVFEARLLSTRNDMQRLLDDLATLGRQAGTLAGHARQLDQALVSARSAWQAGLLDWPTYLAIRSNTLTADMDLLAVQQQQAMQAIALAALLGHAGQTMTPTLSAKASTP